MDDTKTFKIQIKGTAYQFAPLDLEAVGSLSVIMAMQPSPQVILKAAFKPLRAAADPADWDALTDRLVDGEVTVDDITDAMKKLTERTVKHLKDAEASDDDE